MTRRSLAGGLFVLLFAAAIVLIGLHWESDAKEYRQAAVKPMENVSTYALPHGIVNVNTAGYDELLLLQGINKSQIQALLDDRALYGVFDYPEDLIYVKGIGEKTLEKIYDQLDFSSYE